MNIFLLFSLGLKRSSSSKNTWCEKLYDTKYLTWSRMLKNGVKYSILRYKEKHTILREIGAKITTTFVLLNGEHLRKRYATKQVPA